MQPRVVFTSDGESRRLRGPFRLVKEVVCAQCYAQMDEGEIAVLAEPVDGTPERYDAYVHRACLHQYVVEWGDRDAATREGA